MGTSSLARLRRRYARDPGQAWVAGVCAGIARSLNTDPAFLRVGLIVTALFLPKVAVGAYVMAWMLLEPRPTRR